MFTLGTIGIIADDLTGANDTALQFHLRGCNIQILFDYMSNPASKGSTQAWAISTETRNKDAKSSVAIVSDAVKHLSENLGTELFYKKIDSTLRGNVAPECLAMLEALEWDCAVILPAFPTEGRTTVGGYQLLKGMPIERTEVARDPQAPIYQSHVPTLLLHQVGNADIVGHVELKTVIKGAGPVLMEINKLVEEGKKIIVVDSVTTTDIEQVVLAVEKSSYKLLPCGSSGFAQALAKAWLPEMKHQHISKVLPELPLLLISGSATKLTKVQIQKLEEDDEIEPYFINLTPEEVFSNDIDEIVERTTGYLAKKISIVIHTTSMMEDNEKTLQVAAQYGIEADKIPSIITDYLASLTQKITNRQDVILVLVGGETSYKCCNAINSKHLQLIDEVEPSIPLCLDHKAQCIVTKSGNLGTVNTLTNIFKYFEKHQVND